jgi:UDP-glucose 4-epimerase
VGGGEPIAHRDLVELLIRTAGGGRLRFVDWPEDKKRIDIGSFYTDASKFIRTTGWRPAVSLEDGLARTLDYYRAHLPVYLAEP